MSVVMSNMALKESEDDVRYSIVWQVTPSARSKRGKGELSITMSDVQVPLRDTQASSLDALNPLPLPDFWDLVSDAQDPSLDAQDPSNDEALAAMTVVTWKKWKAQFYCRLFATSEESADFEFVHVEDTISQGIEGSQGRPNSDSSGPRDWKDADSCIKKLGPDDNGHKVLKLEIADGAEQRTLEPSYAGVQLWAKRAVGLEDVAFIPAERKRLLVGYTNDDSEDDK